MQHNNKQITAKQAIFIQVAKVAEEIGGDFFIKNCAALIALNAFNAGHSASRSINIGKIAASSMIFFNVETIQ